MPRKKKQKVVFHKGDRRPSKGVQLNYSKEMMKKKLSNYFVKKVLQKQRRNQAGKQMRA